MQCDENENLVDLKPISLNQQLWCRIYLGAAAKIAGPFRGLPIGVRV